MPLKITATVDLNALRHNLRLAQACAPQSQVAAVIKADAYGHGALACLPAFAAAPLLAIARLEEAEALRAAGETRPILIMSSQLGAPDLRHVQRLRLEPVIYHPEQLPRILAERWPAPQRFWLKVDTGMHRLGMTADDFRRAYEQLRAHPDCGAIVAMSHFADADTLAQPAITEAQLHRFNDITRGLAVRHSLANSAGVMAWAPSHGDWVRPGIMLYGSSPFAGPHPVADKLIPAMTLRSRLIAINPVPKGERVGYHGIWTAPRESRIGVVAIGYGDGYPRHAPNDTPVWVKDRVVPLVGRVSMDMITVDLTDHPQAQIGDPVELWGNAVSVDEVARRAGTISYELLTGLTGRVRFQYLDD